MARYLGQTPIAGLAKNIIVNGFHIFDCKWADHLLNDISWLRADTFSWQSGSVYVSAYNELVAEYNNASSVISYSKTVQYYAWGNEFYTLSATPTAGDAIYTYYENEIALATAVTSYDSSNNRINFSYSGMMMYAVRTSEDDMIGPTLDAIKFKRTPKGYKIADSAQETAILNVYNSNGIAWFYILDTTNARFKLPRTKFGFEGLRNNVGDDIAESLPNIKGETNISATIGFGATTGATGAFEQGGNTKSYIPATQSTTGYSLDFNAHNSNAVYQDNAPVQERATQMYLYFYVGQFAQTAIEQTAGITTEQLNAKVDKSDCYEINPMVTTYINGTSGYNIWANGYCEQWGEILCSSNTTSYTVTLAKTYNNTNYLVLGSVKNKRTEFLIGNNKTITTFEVMGAETDIYISWKACGYLAEGEY